MIKIRAWGLWAGATLVMTAACGSSSSSNSTGTGGKTTATSTTTTSVTVGTGTGGGGGVNDPICSNPNAMVSSTCNDCLAGITSNDPCISAFLNMCKGSADCVAYDQCAFGCTHNDGATGGAGGGGAVCLAGDSMGGAGGAANNCINCCGTADATGFDTFNTDFITACICTVGATCASACAM